MKAAMSCPSAADAAPVPAFVQLVLNVYCPTELPKLVELSRCCRRSTPNLKVWLLATFVTVLKIWKVSKGVVSPPESLRVGDLAEVDAREEAAGCCSR